MTARKLEARSVGNAVKWSELLLNTFGPTTFRKYVDDYAKRVAKEEVDAALAGQVPGGSPDRVVTVGNVGATFAIDTTRGNIFTATLTAAQCTVSLPMTTDRAALMIVLKQGTGVNKVTWPNKIKWSFNVTPVLSYSRDQVDVIQLVTYDGGASWLGFLSGGGFQ